MNPKNINLSDILTEEVPVKPAPQPHVYSLREIPPPSPVTLPARNISEQNNENSALDKG
jgi:hypothetical protein